MSSTTYADFVGPPVNAAWLNDVNSATYNAGVLLSAASVQAQITAAATAAGPMGKNVIVNGDCSISQVNGGSLITPTIGATFPLDMMSFVISQTGKLQSQQVNNKLNSLGATFSHTTSVLSSYTPGAAEVFFLARAIEGFNFARFQYGTANAKAGSLQFKVNASVAGTYSGVITNAAQTRCYPFTYIVAANTDTLIQLPNIPGDTGGIWTGATNASAASILFDIGGGSSVKGPANAWASAGYSGVTGTTNLVSQVNGSTLTITDVQFEVGSVCTQFERKLYDQNLRECQRYLQVMKVQIAGWAPSATTVTTNSFAVPVMRSGSSIVQSGQVYSGCSGISFNGSDPSYISTFLTATGAGACWAFANITLSAQI